ncbi:MAG TPA: S-layer homology domain-containing protein [Clostridiales bacterium]|nr:S-layer homology domain-containing protein [Clostridiales bacterium]
MKRLLVSVLAIIVVIGGSVADLPFKAVAAPSLKVRIFSDIAPGHWAEKYIRELKNSDRVSGYPDGSFRPDGVVSYGEFLRMTLAGHSRSKAEKDRHWASPYYEAGLRSCFTRVDIPYSALGQPIPRRLMALVVSGCLGSDKKVSDYGDYARITAQISDVNPATPYEYEIVKAYAAGILSGYPDGTFRPDAYLNRAEAAAVVSRLAGRMENKKLPAEEVKPGTEEAKLPVDGVKPGVGEVNSGTMLIEAQTGAEALYPELDYLLTIRNWDARSAEQTKQLRAALTQRTPEQAAAIMKAFALFANKALPEGKQGLHKEYFGDRPVMFDRLSGSARIFIFPPGYQDEYWGIKPGEVYEEFF